MSSRVQQTQEEAWTTLYRRIVKYLERLGRNGFHHSDDFFVVDENIVSNQHKVEINNLAFLNPRIIRTLQHALVDFPGWEIVIGLSVPDSGGRMRDMGLTIGAHEIIDGLQRQYLPQPYRSFRYEGSRPGTEDH